MVQEYKIPWASWYEPDELNLELPDYWDVDIIKVNESPEILNSSEIQNALNSSIGTPTLFDLAKKARNAVMVVEDISRHTRVEDILKIIIEELNSAGIRDENITIILALGAHRPMMRQDLIKKLGLSIIERVNVENHHPFLNVLYVGKSKLNTPIFINKTYYNADLKIAIGSVIPHGLAGFGGGAKIILPGISGIETLEANHSATRRGIGVGLGHITELRKDIEDVCTKVGLDFSVNIVPSISGSPVGLFAGHYIQAHRAAIELYREIYEFPTPNKKYDIGLFNAYPEDTELSQSIKALNAYFLNPKMISYRGAVVMLTASTEGRGYHSLSGQTGAPLYENDKENNIIWKTLGKRSVYLYSPNATPSDVNHFYPKSVKFYNNFQELLEALKITIGKDAKACIVPTSMQIPKKSD